jgi:hypothetical protein
VSVKLGAVVYQPELPFGEAGVSAIVVTGGVVSTVQVYDTAVVVPPSLLTPSTWNVCDPLDRPLYDIGLEHAVNALLSSWHLNPYELSACVNENDGAPLPLGLVGSAVMLGALGSTVHVYDVTGPVEPPDVSRTLKVCDPLDRPLYDIGLGHDANDPPSSWH